MVGVAVNVSGIPAQIVVADTLIDTVGVTVGSTVTVIALELAVVGEAQVAVDVITHDTVCPSVSVEVMKVELFVPTLVVPTFH